MKTILMIMLLISSQFILCKSANATSLTTNSREEFISSLKSETQVLLEKIDYSNLDLGLIEYLQEQRVERYFSETNGVVEYDCHVSTTVDNVRFEDENFLYEIVGRRNSEASSNSAFCSKENLQSFIQVTKYNKINKSGINDEVLENFIKFQEWLISYGTNAFNKETLITTNDNQISLISNDVKVNYSFNLQPIKLSQVHNDNFNDVITKKKLISILKLYVRDDNAKLLTRDNFKLGIQLIQAESTRPGYEDKKLDLSGFIDDLKI